MHKHIFSILILTLLGSLNAEIERVTLQWRARNCNPSCEDLIEKRLEERNEIDIVTILSGSGQAEIKWKPETEFTYTPLNSAMRSVGPSIQSVSLTVSGNVVVEGDEVVLTSKGDNSRFELLNPPQAQETGLPIQGTTRGRELSEDQIARMTTAQKEKEVVTVKGFLFMPFRRTPYRLVIVNMNFAKPKDN